MIMRKVWITALCFVLVSPILVKGVCEKVNIEGVIKAIGDSEITLDDGTIDGTIVDAADANITVTTKKVQTEVDFGYLEIGMTVKACGTMVFDVLVAENINVKHGGVIYE